MEMVELCDLLLGPLIRQLDAGSADGWHRTQLVAGYPHDLLVAGHKLARNVLQLEMRFRLSHRVPYRG